MSSNNNEPLEGIVEPINININDESNHKSLSRLKRIKLKEALVIAMIVIALIGIILFIVYDEKILPDSFTNKGECFAQHERFSFGKDYFTKIKIGNHHYKVHEDLENPEGAAQTMDKLNTVAKQLIEHLDKKYLTDESSIPIKPEFKKRVIKGIKALKKNFKTANLEENIPQRSGGDTSYVINKGDVFAMCLRDPKNNHKLDPKFNTLTFVLVHELAHLFSSTYGHDDIFWNNFKFLLQEAVTVGLYEPINYKRDGSPYCGIVVTYSPLYDSKLVEYRMSQ